MRKLVSAIIRSAQALLAGRFCFSKLAFPSNDTDKFLFAVLLCPGGTLGHRLDDGLKLKIFISVYLFFPYPGYPPFFFVFLFCVVVYLYSNPPIASLEKLQHSLGYDCQNEPYATSHLHFNSQKPNDSSHPSTFSYCCNIPHTIRSPCIFRTAHIICITFLDLSDIEFYIRVNCSLFCHSWHLKVIIFLLKLTCSVLSFFFLTFVYVSTSFAFPFYHSVPFSLRAIMMNQSRGRWMFQGMDSFCRISPRALTHRRHALRLPFLSRIKNTPQSDSTRSWLAGSLSSFFFLQKNFLPSWTWTVTLKLVLYQYSFPFESLWNEIKAPNYSSFCYDAHLLVCLADLTTILNRLMKLNVLSTPYCVQWNKSLSSHADCDIFCVVNLVVYRYHSAVTTCGAQQGYGDEKCRKIKPGPVVMIFSAEA